LPAKSAREYHGPDVFEPASLFLLARLRPALTYFGTYDSVNHTPEEG
jgi:hypothetical protein